MYFLRVVVILLLKKVVIKFLFFFCVFFVVMELWIKFCIISYYRVKEFDKIVVKIWYLEFWKKDDEGIRFY